MDSYSNPKYMTEIKIMRNKDVFHTHDNAEKLYINYGLTFTI